MKTCVIDASVVLRFLLEEQKGSKEAQLVQEFTSLLKEAQKGTTALLSTPLLPLETGNGLRFTLKDARLAQEVLAKFFTLPIEIIPLTPTQTQKALELSYVSGTTVYDTSYHILALARGAQYLTADNEYYKKAKYLGSIRLLS